MTGKPGQLPDDPRELLPELMRRTRAAKFVPVGLALAVYHGIRQGLALSSGLPVLRASFLRSLLFLGAVLAVQAWVVVQSAATADLLLPITLLAAWYGLGGVVAASQLALVRDLHGQIRDRFGAANTLTLYRFLSIPFVISLIPHFPEDRGVLVTGMAVFALAVVTDLADGLLARLTGNVTEFGRIYDPICDIMINAGICWGAWLAGYLPTWYFVLAEARFLLPLIGGAWIYVYRKPWQIRPTMWGKITVFVYAVFVGLVFLREATQAGFLVGLAEKFLWLSGILMAFNLVHMVDMGLTMVGRTRTGGGGQA